MLPSRYHAYCVLCLLSVSACAIEAKTNKTSHSLISVVRWEFHEFSVHITVILFLLAMIMIKLIFHRIPNLMRFVPESLLLILFGIAFGLIIRYGISSGSFTSSVWKLTPELFFNYLLPPIILEASYSLYNRTFGEYLSVVLLFAVLGTILNFAIIGFALYGLVYIGALGEFIQGRFDLKGLLLFSSLIVAVDPVAVLAIFQDAGIERGLYFIVFGESLLNDAITVVLYEIMSAFVSQDVVTWQQVGLGIASFFTVSLGGLLIGVTVGILSCLITRIQSHLNAFTLILLAYFSYIIADTVGWSGIIAMIGCGLLQSAYAFHNLDHKSVTLIHKLTKLVAEICESVIFLFLGVEVLTTNLEWHTGFVLWSLVLCLCARTLVVSVISCLVNSARLGSQHITPAKQLILVYGGLRGAVAFSLAAVITPELLGINGEYNRRVIITTTLFIILFTVGFMGITMKPLMRLLHIELQPDKKLSLFHVLQETAVDQILAGIETITDVRGRNVIRELLQRLDERYLRRLLQREPETYDVQIMRVYEKIALRLHYASINPGKMEVFLRKVPATLHHQNSFLPSSANLPEMVLPCGRTATLRNIQTSTGIRERDLEHGTPTKGGCILAETVKTPSWQSPYMVNLALSEAPTTIGRDNGGYMAERGDVYSSSEDVSDVPVTTRSRTTSRWT